MDLTLIRNYMKKFAFITLLILCVFSLHAQNNDWAQYSRYAEANGKVFISPRAVLMGDSITDNWAKLDPDWLRDHGLLGRGISGQTTSQMLARFRNDVIELHPEYVVILAGINDIGQNNGFIKLTNVYGNIASMAELAAAHGIKPILCTVLPAGEIFWRREVGDPRPAIDSLNTMIKGLAAVKGYPLVDYHSAMKDDSCALKAAYCSDAVHPNIEGYKKMEIVLLDVLDAPSSSSETKLQFTEASDLTLLGKVFPDTRKPYERMDFKRFGGWDRNDRNLLEMSSGIMVSFRTDAPEISVKPIFKSLSNSKSSGYAVRGFDLYIRENGKWVWAGDCAYRSTIETENGRVRTLVREMAPGMKECLLYLPTYSKETSVKIGIPEGYTIEKGDNPFRHRICLHGSSFMHGANTSRAGQTVPGFLTRSTGLQFCSLGVSGDCKMQPQFANALKEADVDAFVFDAFSNGSDESIEANLFNFIETIQSAKPGVPLIFLGSIRMERDNFNTQKAEQDGKRVAKGEELIAKAVKKYKDVYFIKSNAADPAHDTTADGVHPADWGYHLWAESIREPLLKILRKYGIR